MANMESLLSSVVIIIIVLSWPTWNHCYNYEQLFYYSVIMAIGLSWLSGFVAQEALRSKAPLVEYIPYHCGFQGNTYIPQEVVLLPVVCKTWNVEWNAAIILCGLALETTKP